MRYFSLFSGVGGFELGIERAYADLRPAGEDEEKVSLERDSTHSTSERTRQSPACVGFSEIDKYASAVLKYRFPNILNYGDIQKIDWNNVPDFDLLVGGSPCQDLSVAGKQKGLVGERSGLFYEYVKALEIKKPTHFIWENVKGALSSNGGRDFATILSAFSEAGYSLTWQVLNAKDFGVPQNRERIFVIGTRGERGREVFFERGNDQTYTEQNAPQSSRILKSPLRSQGDKPMILHQNQSGTVTPNEISMAQGANRSHNYQTLLQDSRIRRLTPVECERLMSWDDNHTKYGDFDGVVKEISDSQRYKMCGNGVVSKVVESIYGIL